MRHNISQVKDEEQILGLSSIIENAPYVMRGSQLPRRYDRVYGSSNSNSQSSGCSNCSASSNSRASGYSIKKQ